MSPYTNVESFMEYVSQKNSGQLKFLQAVEEVADYVIPFVKDNPTYQKYRIFTLLILVYIEFYH